MYVAAKDRYKKMKYNRVGSSGLKLPQLSLGLWQNFGEEKPFEEVKEIVLKAFDNGITHFDLANNYGRPGGSAELNMGKILAKELAPYRDELIISTKAGYGMWEGPYGDEGSRKYLIASIDQSLNRLGLKYVDIFYHHRPDYETPLEETMKALADIVTAGKALYVGISSYPIELCISTPDPLTAHTESDTGRVITISSYHYYLIARSSYGLMVQILSGLITYLLLAIYCHENFHEPVSIKRPSLVSNSLYLLRYILNIFCQKRSITTYKKT